MTGAGGRSDRVSSRAERGILPAWHGPYHDEEYGFPLSDDAALFERLVLEINQAGLSWLSNAHHPRPKAEWVKLFKRTFRFTGGEIVGEFLMSIGYLPGAHAESCPVYARVAARRPAWMRGNGRRASRAVDPSHGGP
jgi:3-methyladenine DNA glycosylase Tag